MVKGVPVGYKIPGWKYTGRWREKKTGIGKWKFDFKATKKRKAKSYGGHPRGRTVKWKINAIQSVVKTKKGQYQTHMYGKKKLLKSGKVKLYGSKKN